MTYYVKNYYNNAKRTEYNGQSYHSMLEASYARDLDLRQRAGQIKSWARQVKIPLVVNGYVVCDYWIDFVVEHNNGDREYIEVKGVWMSASAIKFKLFESLFSNQPGVIITVEKQGKQRGRPKLRVYKPSIRPKTM